MKLTWALLYLFITSAGATVGNVHNLSAKALVERAKKKKRKDIFARRYRRPTVVVIVSNEQAGGELSSPPPLDLKIKIYCPPCCTAFTDPACASITLGV